MAFFLTTFLAWLHFPTFGHSAPSQLFVFTPDFIRGTSILALNGLLSPECMAAMEAPIACSATLKDHSLVGNLNSGSTGFCTDACEQSLSHYHDSVLWACRHDPDPWPGVAATVYGDAIWINYNYTCGKGPVPEFYDNLNDDEGALEEDSASPYVILDPFQSTYPTSTANDAPRNAESPTPLKVQGNSKRHIVRDIDEKNWSANAVCQQYTIQPGDTCIKIANAHRVTVAQLRAWNTFINAECTNLNIGDQLCISEPGNQTASPTQSVPYATATVAPPGPVARGTTSKCGRYYLVQSGDYCQRIVSSAGISMELFKAINPDINADCTNLISGLYYCTLPTADWNKPSTTLTTTTSVYVPAPAPTDTGTTPNCYEWYVVQQGDYCAKLVSQFGITMAQLQLWNPELNRGCTNLLTGYAYCVHGEASANQPAAAVAKPTT